MGFIFNEKNKEDNENHNPYILFLILILLILSEDILQMLNILFRKNEKEKGFRILPAPAERKKQDYPK